MINEAEDYCGLVMLPELFSGDLDTIADEIQVVELAKYTEVVLLPEMNVKSAMKMFDDAEAEYRPWSNRKIAARSSAS